MHIVDEFPRDGQIVIRQMLFSGPSVGLTGAREKSSVVRAVPQDGCNSKTGSSDFRMNCAR